MIFFQPRFVPEERNEYKYEKGNKGRNSGKCVGGNSN